VATAGDAPGAGPERAYAPELPAEGRVVLAADESRHLLRVRRVRLGDEIVLFDGRGGSRRARLVEADPAGAVAELGGSYPDRTPPRDVVLAVSPPEAARADEMVAALAELGVRRLLPLATRRTPRGRIEAAVRRGARWARLAREAAKVNGASRCLEIGPPTDLAGVLSAAPACVLLDPDPGVEPLSHLLVEGPPPWLLVGPEGGFDDEERRLALHSGARRARLGTTALRTGTAAVSAAVVVLASVP